MECQKIDVKTIRLGRKGETKQLTICKRKRPIDLKS